MKITPKVDVDEIYHWLKFHKNRSTQRVENGV